MIRTLAAAAAFVDAAGLALLFPKADIVLPSLWEQVAGEQEVRWPSPPMEFLWGAKDELPAQGLVCVGRHVGRVVACVAPRLVPVLAAANGDAADDDPVAEAVRELGPLTGPQLREATGLPKKEHDLVARKWRLPATLPPRDEARRELAALVLEAAGELTAADLGGALGWRRKEAAAVLDEIAEGRDDEAGFRIWARR